MGLEEIGNFAQIPRKCVYFSIPNYHDLKILLRPTSTVVVQLFQLECLKVNTGQLNFN